MIPPRSACLRPFPTPVGPALDRGMGQWGVGGSRTHYPPPTIDTATRIPSCGAGSSRVGRGTRLRPPLRNRRPPRAVLPLGQAQRVCKVRERSRPVVVAVNAGPLSERHISVARATGETQSRAHSGLAVLPCMTDCQTHTRGVSDRPFNARQTRDEVQHHHRCRSGGGCFCSGPRPRG